ncbi:zinc finger protein lsy-27-like [Saccostrea cucullata]|uniref:zinc finger protein lsy-27-like n=1 Tax=Saccostrea cuccullata TaxID=36930 RepID=UPI002ED40845
MANVKYTKRKQMDNPKESETNKMDFQCTTCNRKFKQASNLKRHNELQHNPIVTRYYCDICKKSYCRKDVVQHHIAKEHPDTEFKETLIFTCTSPREMAEKPKEWERPF